MGYGEQQLSTNFGSRSPTIADSRGEAFQKKKIVTRVTMYNPNPNSQFDK